MMEQTLMFDTGRMANGSQGYRQVWHVQCGVETPWIVKVDVKIDSSHPEQGRVQALVWQGGWVPVIDLPGTWMVAMNAPSAYLPPSRQHEIDEWLTTMLDRLVAEVLDVVA